MKAETQYNDFIGNVSADISDFIADTDRLDDIGKYFKLDEQRFKIIGLSFYGPENFSASLLCVDKQKSTDNKEHIVKLHLGIKENILNELFKRLHFVLYNKFDDKYPLLGFDDEKNFDDFHNFEDSEEE